jgi:uncharacterized membrane protein (DUF485 family)
MLFELVSAPPFEAAFAAFLLANGHTLAGFVAVAFFVISMVQAVIYVPRALAAARMNRKP